MMKRRLMVCAAFAAVLLAGNALGDIVDDFEGVGAGSWNTWLSDAAFSIDFDSTAQANSGLESVLMSWSSEVPIYQICEAYQEMAVDAGAPYSASAYARVTTELEGVCSAYLETLWYDDLHNELTGQGFQSAHMSAVQDWTLLENSGTVPVDAETARVRLVVYTSDGTSAQGAIHWDDVSATGVIPEPTSVILLAMGFAGVLLVRRKSTAK